MIQLNCVRQLWTLMVTWCPLKLRTLKRIDTSPPGGTCGILLRADHVTMKPPITYFTVKDGHVIRLLPLGDLIIVVSNFAVQMMKWLKYFWGVAQVSWVRRRDWHILSSGSHVYTADGRFHVLHRPGSPDWVLMLKSPQLHDSGIYECQVTINPFSNEFSFGFMNRILNVNDLSKFIQVCSSWSLVTVRVKASSAIFIFGFNELSYKVGLFDILVEGIMSYKFHFFTNFLQFFSQFFFTSLFKFIARYRRLSRCLAPSLFLAIRNQVTKLVLLTLL